MTEVGWWYTAIFILIVMTSYGIGFWAGMNWERMTWEDKDTKKQVGKKK